MNQYKEYYFFEETKGFILFGKVKDSKLFDIRIMDKNKRSLVGNIYRGRIVDKLVNINTMFIDIDEMKNGFLQSRDEWINYCKEGDSIIVQVVADAVDEKGVVLSRNYELKGKYLILQPFKNKISISRKIASLKKRKELMKFISEKNVENYGMIVRSNSEKLDDFLCLAEELNELVKIHKELLKEINFLPTPKLLLDENSFNNLTKDIGELPVIVSSKELYETLDKSNPLILDKEFSIKNDLSLYEDFLNIFRRKIILENGIELVFDKTEAFNVIDINTPNYVKGNKNNRNLDSVNYESSDEILRQITLRNLSGIILVDFLNFSNKEKQNDLINLLKEESIKYPNPVNIFGLTNLGIMEMTRKKTHSQGDIFEDNLNIIWS